MGLCGPPADRTELACRAASIATSGPHLRAINVSGNSAISQTCKSIDGLFPALGKRLKPAQPFGSGQRRSKSRTAYSAAMRS